MIRGSTALEEIRALIGPTAFAAVPGRWEKAAREDVIALEKAIKDARARIAERHREPIRNLAAWLWKAFVGQAGLQRRHEEGARR